MDLLRWSYKKVASTFRSRPLIYIHNHLPLFLPCGFHIAQRIVSSAISFRLPSDSIPADAFSDSPLSSAFASDVSGPSIPRLAPLPFRFLTPAVSASFRPLQFWILTTQPSALSFPFFPFSPVGGSFGARPFLSSQSLSSSVSPVSMRPFRFRYSASCVSFLRFSVSCHRHYTASGLLFPARPLPFAFALGSGYLACPFRTFRFASDLAYITTATINCQQLFFALFDY